MARDTATLKAAQISPEERPQEKQAFSLCRQRVPPDHRVSQKEERRQPHTCFTVCVKANKHQIKPAVKKLYDIDMAQVNARIRPDGEKKAYIPPAPHWDAVDIANKIGNI